ncbi:hypothetical protein [Roseisalinus antarcticus]|uniref:Uncharacterized protein n=1 Tax=Roseisalinus antarcticus TaxID=254357 RepID=A0A1Y5RGY7_9RHOB|nr:hypothetical protein [Roseisalinus antarcticus]SLN16050.1 hypothetical protein ROA7023_00247 [Roseisalinus antarcticus]
MRWIGLVCALLWPLAGQAQVEVSEAQRCVWSCLSNFGPASNPAYDQCVQTSCAGFAAPTDRVRPLPAAPQGSSRTANGPRWEAQRIIASDPPYLDGYSARVVNVSDQRLSYLCGRGGRSLITLEGSRIGTAPGRYEIRVRGAGAWKPRFVEYEGQLQTTVRPSGVIVRALQGAARAEIYSNDGRRLAGFSLAGSSNAIGQAVRYCAGE